MLKLLEAELKFSEESLKKLRTYTGVYIDTEAESYWTGRIQGLKVALKLLLGE